MAGARAYAAVGMVEAVTLFSEADRRGTVGYRRNRPCTGGRQPLNERQQHAHCGHARVETGRCQIRSSEDGRERQDSTGPTFADDRTGACWQPRAGR